MSANGDTNEVPDIDERFQSLVEEDRQSYGEPGVILVRSRLEEGRCLDACRKKVEDWIAWHGAPYPADRHAEYMYVPSRSDRKVLLSAVLVLPGTFEDYRSWFSRKRRSNAMGRKAANLGYKTSPFRPRDYAEQIYRIIHSRPERQGREVEAAFWDRPPDEPFDRYEPIGCPRHENLAWGVFTPEGGLAAYLLGMRVGDVLFYEEIMGHADHLDNDVMYLLHAELVGHCIGLREPPEFLHYGPWYSGRDPFNPRGGLNRWKRKVRMRPAYLVLASS